MQSSDPWARNYQETIVPKLIFDEPLDVNHTAPSPASDTSLSPNASIGKPTRRRSRASKKKPMTLLKANPNDFRALVQRFTGCHSSTPAFGNHKGPVNLNFAQHNYSSSSEKSEGQSLFSFGDNNVTVAATAATTNHIPTNMATNDDYDCDQSFASTVNCDTRLDDRFCFDDFDMDSFSIQEMSGPGTSHDDFWRY
ncbi:hypothetical protein PHJA_002230100 [Phtheirospermum japonicum]|uniref:VQ domain-containing protein n=1 Tax=Phtheirospermum japonicum TaxID=374723 RepID=A0A830D387_9LAMI|nr:hypothetical protein PHJA_002230100 [Phtheirospermum japonicum]